MSPSPAKKLKPAAALSSLQRRRISLSALVDERTLVRALRGLAVQPMPRERIRRALDAEGLLHLLPTAADDAR